MGLNVTDAEISSIIDFINRSDSKKQVEEFMKKNNYDTPYVFYRIFALRDEELVKKIPNTLFSNRECRMLYYFFGEEGEKYYPSKRKSQAHLHRGENLRIVEYPIKYNRALNLYQIPYYIIGRRNGEMVNIGLAYSKLYKSIKEWLLEENGNLNKKWLYNIEIPDDWVNEIDFTGAYVTKKTAKRIKGTIGLHPVVIEKGYNSLEHVFYVGYGYADDEGKIIRRGPEDYFETLDEFAKFLKNDLSGGDYEGYAFSEEEIRSYRISD